MAVYHQSDLAAFARCAAAYGYQRAGATRRQLSATAYGSVMHHALQVFERARSAGEGTTEAATKAEETFLHYWNPQHIIAICDPVSPDGWLPRQGYTELRSRGVEAIRQYIELIAFDDHELLATEYGFMVPVAGTWDDDLGEPHVLAGSVDRLAVRWYTRVETVCLDDLKTGKEYPYLRHHMQFTAYAYASTRPEFWVGWRGEDGFGAGRGTDLFDRFAAAPRRGTWINLKKIAFQDAGWRGPQDYRRLAVAIEQFHAMVQADIYPLTMVGEVCTFCEFRDVCAGVGLPADDHGAPVPGSATSRRRRR